MLFVTVSVQLKSKYLTNEALEGLGDFKTGGQVIRPAKCADDLVLLAEVEAVLQEMTESLIEIGRCYGMEINVEKSQVLRISSSPYPIQIMTDQKQVRMWNVSNILVA
jgi:hypothetical protein